jgi:hypothetical protein
VNVEYQIDRTQGVIFTRCHGTLEAADMWSIADRLRSDPDFDVHQRQLIDLTEMVGMTASFRAIRNFAENRNGDPFSGHSRRAVVAPRNLAYGLARMYEALREGKEQGKFRVFRTMAEARDWLGLQPQTSEGTASPNKPAR